MYKVIVPFWDKEDEQRTQYAPKNVKSPYAKDGDKVLSVYPREGLTPSKKRIALLKGDKNALGVPLIADIEEEKPEK